ncbi:GDP-mannose 4,6-dehydratase [Parerythrobacter aurantius]|uniref:GDP-mannose 4,6-dehydratase n=1 Tax=Parerythrobacter aurantius TaxID=3127706 RepID=UPI00324401F8
MMQTPIDRHALICGIGGQDGAYLARLLLDKGYRVTGTSRDISFQTFHGLSAMGVREDVSLVSMSLTDFGSVLSTLSNVKPDEIYNLAGQSSVSLSFEQPVDTMESIAIGTLNLLEAIRFVGLPIRFYNAGSSECFGDTGGVKATETTPFRPRSPYAVAKACAHNLVANYREAYGLHASTGILFNHESPLRPERFVTQKVIYGAARIAAGEQASLQLGNLSIYRDWGWAPDYVDAMWRMLQQDSPADFVIATGTTVSLEDFVNLAFRFFGLDWREYVHQDNALLRPSDISYGAADPALAESRLGWKAMVSVEEMVARMCQAAVERLGRSRHHA